MNSEERIFLNPAYFRRKGSNIPQQQENSFTEIPANSDVYEIFDRLCEEKGIPTPRELPRMIQEQHAGAIAVGQAFPRLVQFDAQVKQYKENEGLLNQVQQFHDKLSDRLQQEHRKVQRQGTINKILFNPYFAIPATFIVVMLLAYTAGRIANHQIQGNPQSPATELRDTGNQ